ncbi:MAG TPA: polysaccharide deacetylase family protein [Aliiroseovarius sp.]|nr:polysaccharide deacetylase family protein [Aliiroseovarius sp.]
MGSTVDILMYHSVSDHGGATSIPAPVFEAQMQAIAEARVPVISLDDLVAARQGRRALPDHALILTFDDGYLDFAETAWPVIRGHGWPVTVYLPTRFVGAHESWRGAAEPPRALMPWAQIAQLAQEGVSFGAHTDSHPDLTALPPDALHEELTRSRDAIARHTGQIPRHFAPPYGRTNASVQAATEPLFDTSCGTRLARARASSDLHDLPRLEMFYYQDIAHWRRHLAGRGGPYLALRQTLRTVRARLVPPWIT